MNIYIIGRYIKYLYICKHIYIYVYICIYMYIYILHIFMSQKNFMKQVIFRFIHNSFVDSTSTSAKAMSKQNQSKAAKEQLKIE